MQVPARLVEFTRGQAAPGPHEQIKSGHFLAMAPERLAYQALEKAAIDSEPRGALPNYYA
jgi:hypothetical protein